MVLRAGPLAASDRTHSINQIRDGRRRRVDVNISRERIDGGRITGYLEYWRDRVARRDTLGGDVDDQLGAGGSETRRRLFETRWGIDERDSLFEGGWLPVPEQFADRPSAKESGTLFEAALGRPITDSRRSWRTITVSVEKRFKCLVSPGGDRGLRRFGVSCEPLAPRHEDATSRVGDPVDEFADERIRALHG